ncbi:MAG: hypothetical protein IKS32_02830 [Solobacterium sp.]|nr:hypothetical protein [Solobacterium sp.]
MRFETYEQAEQWILSRKKLLVYYEPFAAAMKEAGDPQKDLLCFHVAGTNGKGSTCCVLYEILRTKYRKVGRYTSPQLISFRDRTVINDEWIPGNKVLEYANRYEELIERYELGTVGISTMFSFLWFKEEKVDAAVIETTMGGRYDTTNIIPSAAVSVITSIGFDHMEFLGGTLAEIAGEKAGIIKENRPVVIGDMEEEALAVIEQEAAVRHARVLRCLPFEDCGGTAFLADGIRYETGNTAPYFKYDAALALTAAKTDGIDLSSEAVRAAVKNSSWPGRFETVSVHPRIVIDGAHNPDGMNALKNAARECPHPLIGVFTALKDKQGPEMKRLMESFCDSVIVTEFSNYRAADAASLGGCIVKDWRKAVEEACALAGETGTVLVSGSLYFISEVRNYVLQKQKQKQPHFGQN